MDEHGMVLLVALAVGFALIIAGPAGDADG